MKYDFKLNDTIFFGKNLWVIGKHFFSDVYLYLEENAKSLLLFHFYNSKLRILQPTLE